MVEHRTRPGAGRVALGTGLREVRGYVVRVRGALEVFQVTRNAGRIRQVVVIVDVAIAALPRRDRVCAGQREPSCIVIECRIGPGARAVALGAGLREVRRNVVRVRGALKVLQVTRNTCRTRQIEIVIGVAICALAWRHRMRPGQGKIREVVVERGV